ncbi:benzoate transporter [Sinomonas cyclohexanicum]|uniref:Benzoate transporter n=1 Tax=Sinomonas cyclohexanicum TaxID=322009 RepID=A0ABM7PWN3_SINCY|nr:MFS transporter [Corynebacterium cyclohexanicum]BCT76703.1 benzoate transporter [Corynebacterium cyclohexanicum]
MSSSAHAALGQRRRSTLAWVVALGTAALTFDGYDLVVYGTVVSGLMRDPAQIGQLDPATAGVLGSYALIGVMVGALVSGAIGDFVGRRKVMLAALAWFSLGMGATALATDVVAFGALRFLTGIGVGSLVATAGAIVAEFAPKNRRNFYNAIVYSGVPGGGVLASLLALAFNNGADWRPLFWFGAAPLAVILPLAAAKLPESPLWLLARGRTAEAEALGRRTGVVLPRPAQRTGEPRAEQGAAPDGEPAGFAGLATRRFALPTALLGLMSFAGLLLTYGLNTWLPEIMGQYGFGKAYSLTFLLVLNASAIVGGLVASATVDRTGPKRIIAGTFALAALALILLTFHMPFAVLLTAVGVAGVGTIGTQVLVYGYVSNFYTTRTRAAGVAWCAGFGRLGGILGPLLGGLLLSAGVTGQTAFYLFAAVALLGAVVTALVPRPRFAPVPPGAAAGDVAAPASAPTESTAHDGEPEPAVR